MRQLHGVVYPTPTPTPGQAAPPREPDDEEVMALRYVRTAFDPPLPDAFATWLIHLHGRLRDGEHPDTRVIIPKEITDMGFTFTDARPRVTDDRYTLSFAEALRVFGRDDLIFRDDTEPRPGAVRTPGTGVTALAAALVARGIRTTTTLHRNQSTCTVALTDEQAGHLATALLPEEGSIQDDLGNALELLDHFVHNPHPTACVLDHHGHCQEHHDVLDNGRSAQHEGYALLLKHGVREEA